MGGSLVSLAERGRDGRSASTTEVTAGGCPAGRLPSRGRRKGPRGSGPKGKWAGPTRSVCSHSSLGCGALPRAPFQVQKKEDKGPGGGSASAAQALCQAGMVAGCPDVSPLFLSLILSSKVKSEKTGLGEAALRHCAWAILHLKHTHTPQLPVFLCRRGGRTQGCRPQQRS